jgi:hypothetical protein
VVKVPVRDREAANVKAAPRGNANRDRETVPQAADRDPNAQQLPRQGQPVPNVPLIPAVRRKLFLPWMQTA